MIRYTNYGLSMASNSLTMFGWSNFERILISLLACLFLYISISLLLSYCLIATFSPDGLCVPNFTTAYAPHPIWLPKLYILMSEQFDVENSRIILWLGVNVLDGVFLARWNINGLTLFFAVTLAIVLLTLLTEICWLFALWRFVDFKEHLTCPNEPI